MLKRMQKWSEIATSKMSVIVIVTLRPLDIIRLRLCPCLYVGPATGCVNSNVSRTLRNSFVSGLVGLSICILKSPETTMQLYSMEIFNIS